MNDYILKISKLFADSGERGMTGEQISTIIEASDAIVRKKVKSGDDEAHYRMFLEELEARIARFWKTR